MNPEATGKVLVTGGAGFLGSHLCERLVSDGRDVVCVDNLYTGSKKNVEHLFNSPRFEFIHHDVQTPLHLDVDQIFNLACPASPAWFMADPVFTAKTSLLGAINLLDLAKAQSARILQASTSEIYGDPKSHPQDEIYWGNVNPIGVRACYDEGKRCAETLFFDYFRHFQVDIRLVRIFNTYGPRMHRNDGRVVSNFIVQALNNAPITIFGDGSQTRSFCYVDDLIDGLLVMMTQEAEIGPVNLGNRTEYQIGELAELVLELTGSSSQIVYLPLPEDDPVKRQPDIQKAKLRLDWKPTVPLEDGLREVIHYFRKTL